MGKKKEANKVFIIGLLILVVIFLSKQRDYSGRFVQEPSKLCPHEVACANLAYQMYALCIAAGFIYDYCSWVYDTIYNSCMTKCNPPPVEGPID